MSNKTLEGMALRYKAELGRVIFTEQASTGANEVAMKAALLWLADNVSDEMVEAYEKFLSADSNIHTRKDAIAAALRAAASSAPTPPEVK